jgi:Sulfotransferase family
VRNLARTVSLYGRSAARVFANGRRRGSEERLVFVVGSPRSGTTFVAGAIGRQPGFVDLGEVLPLKAAIPDLCGLPPDEATRRLRHILERVRLLGLARGVRAVEQTPEMAFLTVAARGAYPRARIVHVVRDGRDVVCSLLERGWLGAGRTGSDDARLSFGPHARFWVEPERRDEFPRVSDATRAAWMWRRYLTAAQGAEDAFELRYESLVADPGATAERLARFLGSDPGPLGETLARAHARSLGRWRAELTAAQLADVEGEAGPLLARLGYAPA